MDKRKYSRLKEDPSQLQMFADEAMDNINEQHHEIGQIEETLPNKASLVDGKVPSTELPSYVDDVVEYASLSNFPEEGEAGKIYLAIDTSLCYRWSGTQYIQIAGSTSVLMFASQANFPAEGEEGVIYVAEDTNKQYRWTGTAYVELGGENEIEIVNYQTTTPLTDEQMHKAAKGKLVIVIDARNMHFLCEFNDTSFVFRCVSYNSSEDTSSSNVPYSARIVVSTVTLNRQTKMMTYNGNTNLRSISSTMNANFFASNVEPAASGKRIARELNLRKTQDMISNVYDTTATYDVGDVVMRENNLYRCIASTSGAWDASKWQLTNMAEIAKEKGANIVEITSSDMEVTLSDSRYEEIKAADALYLSATHYLYWRYTDNVTNNVGTIKFKWLGMSPTTQMMTGASFELTTANKRLSQQINEILNVVDRNRIVTNFSTSKSYSPGDLVYHSYNLYRCIAAHSGAWDTSHFTQTVLADEVHSDIVTITATGVQTDEMAAKILNAKAVVYDRVYTLYSADSSTMRFVSVWVNADSTAKSVMEYNKSTKDVTYLGVTVYSRVASIGGKYGKLGIDSSLQAQGSGSITLGLSGKLPYLDTAPTADNTSGFITIVVLSAEPATRYNGYLYIITGSN